MNINFYMKQIIKVHVIGLLVINWIHIYTAGAS